MTDEIQLISDGDGLSVIGEPAAIELFLSTQQLPSKELPLKQIAAKLGGSAGSVLKGASEVASQSGRWVQMTEESYRKVQAVGLMTSKTNGLNYGVIQGQGGKIQGLVQFAQGPGSVVANPAVLAGVGGVMAQMAMQQAMDEITEYLAVIDEKVDDILRGQKDAAIADMIGVDLMIDEAMIVRREVGRVSETTWSKVQSTALVIARTQGYSLRQLDAIAEKLERKANVGDLAAAVKVAESSVPEWLAVLARCFQLQDAVGILELDRVLDADPDELNQHRLGLRAARQSRLDLIAKSSFGLLARMDAAAGRADCKVLLNPFSARAVVDGSNRVATGVTSFHGRLGIEQGRESIEATRWVEAAVDARDKVLVAGADGVGAAQRFGTQTFERGRATSEQLRARLAKSADRRGNKAGNGTEDAE